MSRMSSLDTAVDTARRALPDREIEPDGWVGEDGTYILVAGTGTLRDDIAGMDTLAKVSPDGTVTTGPLVWFMPEIDTMTEL